jgi:hypothetical protein
MAAHKRAHAILLFNVSSRRLYADSIDPDSTTRCTGVQPNYRARKAVNGAGVENHLDFKGLNKSQWFT